MPLSALLLYLPSDSALEERFLVQQCSRLVGERTHRMGMWVLASRLSCFMFPVKLMNSFSMLSKGKTVQPLMKHRSKHTSKHTPVPWIRKEQRSRLLTPCQKTCAWSLFLRWGLALHWTTSMRSSRPKASTFVLTIALLLRFSTSRHWSRNQP